MALTPSIQVAHLKSQRDSRAQAKAPNLPRTRGAVEPDKRQLGWEPQSMTDGSRVKKNPKRTYRYTYSQPQTVTPLAGHHTSLYNGAGCWTSAGPERGGMPKLTLYDIGTSPEMHAPGISISYRQARNYKPTLVRCADIPNSLLDTFPSHLGANQQ